MSKTVCINQSNYIPWRGYFDMMRKSDEFILGDSVQYTAKDWRNRNQIKMRDALLWLTIPVANAGRLSGQRIDETRVVNRDWAEKHLASLRHAYGRSPHFGAVNTWLDTLYRRLAGEPLLSRINEAVLREIAGQLSIQVPIRRTTDYLDEASMTGIDRTERIIRLCRAAGATRYLSGPAAKVYLDEAAMAQAGIEVEWMDYSGYPPYPQMWGEFVPNVSILDLLFCMGEAAGDYIGRREDR